MTKNRSEQQKFHSHYQRNLYTWVERGTVIVKYFAQEHNTMSPTGLQPGPLDPESNALAIRPPPLLMEVVLDSKLLSNEIRERSSFRSSCYTVILLFFHEIYKRDCGELYGDTILGMVLRSVNKISARIWFVEALLCVYKVGSPRHICAFW